MSAPAADILKLLALFSGGPNEAFLRENLTLEAGVVQLRCLQNEVRTCPFWSLSNFSLEARKKTFLGDVAYKNELDLVANLMLRILDNYRGQNNSGGMELAARRTCKSHPPSDPVSVMVCEKLERDF